VSLILSEEQELLAHSAREFVRARSSVARVRTLRDGNDADGFSRELWQEMARLGWLGIVIPERCGGAGLGYVELTVVMEALGQGLMPEPMLSTVLLGGSALLLGGSATQQQDHLPRVAAGERLLAMAYQEQRSRYDPTYVEFTATGGGESWTLQGEKLHVLDGHAADWLVVSARTGGAAADASGVTLFLVPSDAPGITIVPHTRVDARKAATVRFDGVEVGRDAVLGDVDAGGPLLSRIIARSSVGLCAESVGAMAAAFEMTTDYLKTRKQFGVPIGSFQALKHRAAQMYIEIELSRSAVSAAAHSIDEGGDDAAVCRAASVAKAKCSDAFVLVGNEGVQMHGGIGMTDEHDIGFFLKRARAAEMTFGDAAYHRDQIARLDGY
jgi:alkylation response protein AidB-like acyl-CoA dehydrogenase